MKSVDLDASVGLSGDTEEDLVESFRKGLAAIRNKAQKDKAEVLWGTLEIQTETEVIDSSSMIETDIIRNRTLSLHAIGVTSVRQGKWDVFYDGGYIRIAFIQGEVAVKVLPTRYGNERSARAAAASANQAGERP